MKTELTNPSTGNTFYVLGFDSTNNLVAGIRFWVDKSSSSGKGRVGFRLRLESDGATHPNMEQTCKTAYPKAKWTGGSSIHGSTAGLIKLDYPLYMVTEILEALKDGDIGGSLHDAFTTVFSTLRLSMNREQFSEYFLKEVEKLLKGDPNETSKVVSIEFMGYTKTAEATETPTTVSEPPKLLQPLVSEPETL